LIGLARVALAQDRPETAAEHATQALADFRRRDDARGVAGSLVPLGVARRRLGEDEPGLRLLAEARDLAHRWGFATTERDAERALAAPGQPRAP
jgi:hypothetical protein